MEEQTSSQNKKKDFIVNPRFQWTIALWGVGLFFFVIFIVYCSDKILFIQLKSIGTDAGFDPSHMYYQTLQEFEKRKTIAFFILSFFLAVFLIVFCILFSHRIAGPIYQAIKHLREYPNSEILKFRNKDFFPELAEAINQTLKKLSSRTKNGFSDKL